MYIGIVWCSSVGPAPVKFVLDGVAVGAIPIDVPSDLTAYAIKKLLKKRKLYRGVPLGHDGYTDAKRGYVAGSYFRFGDPRVYLDSTAEKHNDGIKFNTPFSNWTARRGIAKSFATNFRTSNGILISAMVRTFRIFKSPDKYGSIDFETGRPTKREYEFLVVGPVMGIPTVVHK